MLKIHVDQLGYRRDSRKLAVVASDEPLKGPVSLVNVDNSTSVELLFYATGEDTYSGDTLWTLDFSHIQEKGRYFIEFYNNSRSPVFTISDSVYNDAFHDMIRMFYFQRCGCALEARHAGPYTHDCCHTGKVIRYKDGCELEAITGGWHDAGDYGRYTTAGAVAAAHLLYAYSLFPERCPDLQLPESGNGVPDILNECRYELEWLMKMQQADGGVAHKLTTANHAPFIMPEEDLAQLYLYPVSTMATADLAAVCALAERIYRPYDGAFADRLRTAALRARDFLRVHPEMIGFLNPPDCRTGSYQDRFDADERLWASAELFRMTGDQSDLEELTRLAEKLPYHTGLGWADVSGLAGLSVLTAPENTFPSVLYEIFQKDFLDFAHRLLTLSESNGYHLAMMKEAFVWGSNMVVMSCAATLLLASQLTGQRCYADAAEENIHYLFGRNPLDRSYVSGHGTFPFRNPHLRTTASEEIEEPFPGLVSGGPNVRPCDDAALAQIPNGTPPLYCHADDVGSFSTNEIAIYWNSIAVLVLAFFVQQ